MNSHAINILGVILGIIVGASTMFFTVKDRMTREVEDRVEYRIKTETQLTRCQERIKSLESDVWQLRTQEK